MLARSFVANSIGTASSRRCAKRQQSFGKAQALTRVPAQRGARAFEWYSEWAQLRPLVRAAVGTDEGSPTQLGGRLLVVGCGNSELSAQLYDDGFQDITNIDFSKARTARSTQHYADLAWLSTRHV